MTAFRLVAPLLAGALVAVAGPASAQDEGTDALQVGAPAPDFTLMDADGERYRLSELVEAGPVVLEFFRSGDW